VKKAKAGDRAAFDSLVKSCARDIYNFCLRLCRNREAAEDIAQEAFISAYKSIGGFEEKSPFKGWVYRIAVNAWKNRVRYEKRRFFSKHDSLDEAMETEEGGMQRQVADIRQQPDMDAEKEMKKSAIHAALSGLSPDMRQMIVLRDMEELSYDEIAGVLRLPLGTVKSRIARARETLAEKLRELKEGGENE
ncbi:MAG TPA: sigma-70 family RNA polymerase sigma factor, partial [Candidatus Goldiibacteriota bacterium]|nr:sigma-70 family RNA polymerase sigma factor [Candidatus Goldiibacteriota bacterium]